ncbi:Receptor-type guanylate cyclase Gyc76C like protein [Argiope bruennichi]|uniref:Receptor-type guanylate cyclase Gyc76C like protein n=1 Tax=Argiope bruennichi TaxID=94029 RepID=A0A8T0E0E5_ARGBR|nr:Receptor-type guanylate cyclase Gyc76C like protein [Argiope bruennichi]
MIRLNLFWISIIVFCDVFIRLFCHGEIYTVGYLTGSERRPGNMDYHRPGLSISGAITLAADEINRLHPLVDGHQLNFTIAETYGDEEESILQVALLWTQKIAGYIGPQETCLHEAKMASGFNLPMISYVSRISFSFIWCFISVLF